MYLRHSKWLKKNFCRCVNHLESQGCESLVVCLCILLTYWYLLTMHAAGYMHSFIFDAVPFRVLPIGMKIVWLTLVQALGRLNPFPL